MRGEDMRSLKAVIKAKVGLSEGLHSWCVSLCSDLIAELYGQSVRIVKRRVVRLEGDVDVLTLSWSNAPLYWRCREHTQPAVVLCSWTGYKSHR